MISKDKEAKKTFASNDGLRKVQQIKAEEGSKLQESIEELIALYPKDIAQYYSADYENVLVDKVWNWFDELPIMFVSIKVKSR